MRSIQNLYDLGDGIGERGQYSGGPNVFASVFLCLPLQGWSWLSGANGRGSGHGIAGVTWM
ncbi:MAG: hypothetical protein GY924_04760 [Planctomycetaceae bacterium]|nr:hypothetical protein [Planctomycetaceae bacterium]